MKAYLELVKDILENGYDISAEDERTGTGSRNLFGVMLKFDLQEGFPLVTTRYVPPKNFILETLFFLKGLNNINWLKERNCSIWNEWAATDASFVEYLKKLEADGLIDANAAAAAVVTAASNDGYMGPMYGSLWRCWPRVNTNLHPSYDLAPECCAKYLTEDQHMHLHSAWINMSEEEKKEANISDFTTFLQIFMSAAIDQIFMLIEGLKHQPYSRRHIVTAVNPEYYPAAGLAPNEQPHLGKGCLMPCHTGFQCMVRKNEQGENVLDLMFNMRSSDVMVGLPTNIAGYALLCHLLAREVNMIPGKLTASLGSAHIYNNHIENAKLQLEEVPDELPELLITPSDKHIFQLEMEDISLVNYTATKRYKYERNV